MLNKIHISPKAGERLFAVYKFILSEFGETYAVKFHEELMRKLQQIKSFPESGHLERVTTAGRRCYRSRIVGKYNKLIYYTSKDTLYVVSIWDMRMERQDKKIDS